MDDISLEILISIAGKSLRSISWHSDGRIICKSSAGATNPRKNYSSYDAKESLMKLIRDNVDKELYEPRTN